MRRLCWSLFASMIFLHSCRPWKVRIYDNYHIFSVIGGEFIESLLETAPDFEETVLLYLVQVELSSF